MERRRLQSTLEGLAHGVQQIGMNGLMEQMQSPTPMTGTGVKSGGAPKPKTGGSLNADGDSGDASEMTGDQQDYMVPARPTTLAQESDPQNHPLMPLLRRRMDTGFGRRRL